MLFFPVHISLSSEISSFHSFAMVTSREAPGVMNLLLSVVMNDTMLIPLGWLFFCRVFFYFSPSGHQQLGIISWRKVIVHIMWTKETIKYRALVVTTHFLLASHKSSFIQASNNNRNFQNGRHQPWRKRSRLACLIGTPISQLRQQSWMLLLLNQKKIEISRCT